ncbi:Uncharacterised protein [Mycobacteroides abscessus subsp. abscessus]|nr:Uncharacterised protein [Mycobacteroides abscessus subsp. abscessus]
MTPLGSGPSVIRVRGFSKTRSPALPSSGSTRMLAPPSADLASLVTDSGTQIGETLERTSADVSARPRSPRSSL